MPEEVTYLKHEAGSYTVFARDGGHLLGDVVFDGYDWWTGSHRYPTRRAAAEMLLDQHLAHHAPDHHDPPPCEDCEGTGEVIINPNWPSGTEPHSEKCSTCGGTGVSQTDPLNRHYSDAKPPNRRSEEGAR